MRKKRCCFRQRTSHGDPRVHMMQDFVPGMDLMGSTGRFSDARRPFLPASASPSPVTTHARAPATRPAFSFCSAVWGWPAWAALRSVWLKTHLCLKNPRQPFGPTILTQRRRPRVQGLYWLMNPRGELRWVLATSGVMLQSCIRLAGHDFSHVRLQGGR